MPFGPSHRPGPIFISPSFIRHRGHPGQRTLVAFVAFCIWRQYPHESASICDIHTPP